MFSIHRSNVLEAIIVQCERIVREAKNVPTINIRTIKALAKRIASRDAVTRVRNGMAPFHAGQAPWFDGTSHKTVNGWINKGLLARQDDGNALGSTTIVLTAQGAALLCAAWLDGQLLDAPVSEAILIAVDEAAQKLQREEDEAFDAAHEAEQAVPEWQKEQNASVATNDASDELVAEIQTRTNIEAPVPEWKRELAVNLAKREAAKQEAADQREIEQAEVDRVNALIATIEVEADSEEYEEMCERGHAGEVVEELEDEDIELPAAIIDAAVEVAEEGGGELDAVLLVVEKTLMAPPINPNEYIANMAASIGDALRNLRLNADCGLSITKVGEAVAASTAPASGRRWSSRERGVSTPTWNEVQAFCVVMNLCEHTQLRLETLQREEVGTKKRRTASNRTKSTKSQVTALLKTADEATLQAILAMLQGGAEEE